MKSKLKKLEALFSLTFITLVLLVVYSFYCVFKFFFYPITVIIRFIKSKNKKKIYCVFYDDLQLFGPELYIEKPYQTWTDNIVIQFSGTYKECRHFLKKKKKEEKELLLYRKKMKNKNKTAYEFFYDSEFDDYTKPSTNSDINRGFLF